MCASPRRGSRSLRRPELRGELDARLGWYVGIGTIPIAVFGLRFKDQIETGARNLWIIGTALVLLGLVLLFADRVGRKDRPVDGLDLRDGVWVGGAQALALIPGISRSGATITAGLFLGFTVRRPRASRSCCRSRRSCCRASSSCAISATAAARASCRLSSRPSCRFVVGYASIAWLLRYLARAHA